MPLTITTPFKFIPTGVCAIQAYADLIQSYSPTYYWRLAEGSGTAADEGGGSPTLNGTYVSDTSAVAGFLTDDTNQATFFDGASSTSYIDLPGPFLPTASGENFSFIAWIQTSYSGSSEETIISQWNGTSDPNRWILFIRGNDGELVYEKGAIEYSTSGANLNDGNPHMIGFSVEGADTGQITFYVDGEVNFVTPTSDTDPFQNTGGRIAHKRGSGSYISFRGTIDEISIHRGQLLSETDFLTIYNIGQCQTTTLDTTPYRDVVLADSPTAFWPLDEKNNAFKFEDITGNGYRGTIQNAGNHALHEQPGGILTETQSTSISYNSFGWLRLPNASVFDGGNNAYTVEAWVYATSAGVWTNNGAIWANHQSSYTIRLGAHNGLAFFEVKIGGTFRRAQSSNTLGANTWYHIVGRYDGNFVRIEVNTTEEDTQDCGGAPCLGASVDTTTSTPVMWRGGNGLFGARKQMVAFWDGVAISDSQIDDHYAAAGY